MNERPMQLTVADGGAELLIYGDICQDARVISKWLEEDCGTDSLEVARALDALPQSVRQVTVRINSFGGDVAEGLAIYNSLRACGRDVRTVVDGFACSIASVVFMAGSERVMRESSMLMVHNPWLAVRGNAEEIRKAADDLDKIAELSYAAYERGGASREDVKRLMDEETWLSPAECAELGLSTATEAEPEGPAQRARQSFMALASRARPREERPAARAEEPPAEEEQQEEPPEEEAPRGYRRLAALLAD